jgi:hypothetical protein
MMRLHDNLSSGNGYKVRLLLTQLGNPMSGGRLGERPGSTTERRLRCRRGS